MEGRILLCPASDPILKMWVSTYIPIQYRRLHVYLDGWEMHPSFEVLVMRIAGAAYSPDAVCRECLAGSPCAPWVEGVQARFAQGWALHPVAWRMAWEASNRMDDFYTDRSGSSRTKTTTRSSSKRDAVDRAIRDAVAALEIDWPCDLDEVHVAFRRLALEAHPDHGGDDKTMIRLIDARKVLVAALDGG